MKKVTEYVKVGELCEAHDGSVLKCVKDKNTDCEKCYYEHKDCFFIPCIYHDRGDGTNVHFEKIDQ